MFILIWMLFMHIVDDYYLQGWLAQGKQKTWWEKNAPNKKYKNDYLMALFMHSFSWAFMIMLPIAVKNSFNLDIFFYLILFANLFIHFTTDNLKANEKKINLIQDQFIHMLQVFMTWIILKGG